MFSRIALGTALFCAAATGAFAQQSEVLFSHKHWQVEIVGWDDGRLGCVAQVSAPGESFSLWTFPDKSVQLQFYSTAWQFDDGSSANLNVQIDRRTPWTLNNAELYKNSVLFTLPGSDAGVDFIVEVAQGTRLYLRAEDGSDVQNYSLSGSRASIDALVDCGKVISGRSPGNPFN
ncbi:MAG: hypothetical protein HC844_16795 [Tabrizicola sp.]|nr:hypothetical protein [Tabrizicola sp.]